MSLPSDLRTEVSPVCVLRSPLLEAKAARLVNLHWLLYLSLSNFAVRLKLELTSFLTFHHLSVSKMKPQQRTIASAASGISGDIHQGPWPMAVYAPHGRPGHHQKLVAHAASDHFFWASDVTHWQLDLICPSSKKGWLSYLLSNVGLIPAAARKTTASP